jgi:hypothetical protein
LSHEIAGQSSELFDSLRRRERNFLAFEAPPCDHLVVFAHFRDAGRAIDAERAVDRRAVCSAFGLNWRIGVIVGGLELRPGPTTRMPERKNLHFVTADPVVKKKVNSRKMKAPDVL